MTISRFIPPCVSFCRDGEGGPDRGLNRDVELGVRYREALQKMEPA